jgi:GDP-mannose 6-dehydrogenase
MNLSIFGLGYVGCVSLGCLAQNGHNVIGVDISETKVDLINDGKTVIVERDIDAIILQQYKLGRISATKDSIEAIRNTEVSFICVGTPPTINGHLNLSAVFNVAEQIAKGIKQKDGFHVIALRSTVLPGTNEKMIDIIQKQSGKSPDRDFAAISNPEFLREGTSVHDFYNPPYILVGGRNENAIAKMRNIYEGINAPFIITEVKIAEMIKYVNNAFHALKITFANEIGNLCKKMQIDSHKLMEIFCMDNKLNLSAYYLKPGFAYGGSCLPKDLKAIKTIAHDFYMDCPLIENIEKSNENQKEIAFNRILTYGKKNVGFLGLSFKFGTDDLRGSPIIDIIERLLGKGFNVLIYDKNVRLSQLIGANRKFILDKIPYISNFITDDPVELIEKSDVIVIVNKEEEFKNVVEKIPEKKFIYDLVRLDVTGRKKNNYDGIAW